MATALPPPKYDVPPSIPVIERIVSFDEVQRICNKVVQQILVPGQHWNGCAKFEMQSGHKVCLIWYTGDATTLRHERAHCSGWPKNHEGGW